MRWKPLVLLIALLILLAGCSHSTTSQKVESSISDDEMKKVATEWITKQQKLNEATDETDLKKRINELYVPDGTAADNVFKIAKKSLGNQVAVKIDRLSVNSISAESFEFKAMYETTYVSPNKETFTRAEEHTFVLQKVNGVFKYASNH
ncbi:hypothetical protein ACQCN2_07360 [Brevibacillus ginsengisoli]|uniref:hypothetical protein n=1 Tax=Brevibacillus ginsengisoli TaxID=363854 RepID=UPI003CF5CC27